MPDAKDLLEMLLHAAKRGKVQMMDEDVVKVSLGTIEDNDGSPNLTHLQVETRLREYYAQVFAPDPEHLEPGDIVYHKNPSLADIKGTRLGDGSPNPHIVTGILDKVVVGTDYIRDSRELSLSSTAHQFDMLVGCISGDVFTVYLSDSRIWTKTKPS